jgi:predicted Zn-dependent peptidase
MDAAAFSAALQAEAIDMSVSTGRTNTTLSVDCTVDTLPSAMRLLQLALTEPRFDVDEVERARTQRIQARKDARDNPRAVASSVGWQQFYGPQSPYAHAPTGTAESLETILPDSLAQSWSVRAHPEQVRWILVGDLDTEASLAMIADHFADWTARGALRADLPPPPGITVPSARGARFMVDNPGASQTVLRVWMPGWTTEDPQRVAGDLGTVVLGGTFTSRLNSLLREEKGYTYGARASLVSGRGAGTVSVSTNVFIDQTGAALTDLAAELARFTEGITTAEAGKATASRRTDAIEVAASRAGSASLLASLAADGRNADGQLADLHMAARIEASDINGVLPRLQLDDSLVVVVGDLERIRGDVEAALPGDWVELDASGNPTP